MNTMPAIPPMNPSGEKTETSAPDRLEEEWLARYLDGELTGEERECLERRLAGSLELQERLVDLFREGQAAMDPRENVRTVESHPAGERIEWEPERQQRKRPPPPLADPAANAKSRKRRLSTGQS